jgi:hypothetical protein
MSTMEDITNLCRTLSASRRSLATACALAQMEIDAVKDKHMLLISGLSKDMAEVYDALTEAVEANPDLFVKPKTLVLSDIKVGYAKQPGKITIADAVKTIGLIRALMPEHAPVLIKTTERPIKKALNALPAAMLRKLGVTVTDSGEHAVIIPQDSSLEKLVAALLGDPSTSAEASADRSTGSDASEEEAA